MLLCFSVATLCRCYVLFCFIPVMLWGDELTWHAVPLLPEVVGDQDLDEFFLVPDCSALCKAPIEEFWLGFDVLPRNHNPLDIAAA